MAYLESRLINVFPATRRTYNSAHSRLVTESALTGMVRNLTDADSFVASPLKDDYSGFDAFIFNIHGYYFRALLGDIIDLNIEPDIYASITLTANNMPYKELQGQDYDRSDGAQEYQGLTFTGYPVTGNNVYCLHLLHYNSVDGKWEVPNISLNKFYLSSLDIDLIDGGEI